MNPTEQWHLETTRLGKTVLVFERLDSTNSFALARAADVSNDGLVVLADEQTAGRGQHGRTWSCPGGSGVLMSVLLYPDLMLRRPAILTAWVAVTVCELIRQVTGLESTIKWPNDVLVNERKVCGILIEQAHGTVVGIGLNVNQPAECFAAAGLPQAASLAMLTGQTWNCRDVARQLIVQLDSEYERLSKGNLQALEQRWQSRFGLIGRQVQAETTTGTHQGLLLDLTFGRLKLQTADAAIVHVAPEMVRHIAQQC